jgi:hypothetical protein
MLGAPGGYARMRVRSLKRQGRGGIQPAMNNTNRLTPTKLAVSWVLQLLAAGILLQTLFFKFSGAEESIYIFTTLGAEPAGRIGSGIVELVAAILLLVPATIPLGAALAMGTMAGAIVSHLTILGISIMDDGGLLFALALTVFASSAIVLALRRGDLPIVGRYFQVAS